MEITTFTGCKIERGSINNIVQQCFSSGMHHWSFTQMKLALESFTFWILVQFEICVGGIAA